jgi:membrane-associated phospholipid phosphatase
MEFDIQYLLWLQDLRIATGGVFDEFFNALSKFAVDIMPFLPFVVFWCADKKWGYRYITTWGLGEMINGIIKLTVCAYRPWIRSDLIEPAGDSKVAATGYSFPSGHMMVATVTYGTTIAWQKDKRRWLAVLCGVLILLTGFSRNFLGVHTPQDVFVGFCESVIIIWVVGAVSKKIEGNEKTLDILTMAGVILVVLTIVYIMSKPYPMDYVDGELLVDPQHMMNDTFKACGAFLGLLIGSYIDRHYLKYEIPVGAAELPMLTCIGAAIMFSWKEWFAPATIVAALGGHWGNLIVRGIMVFFAITIWPMVITKTCSKES